MEDHRGRAGIWRRLPPTGLIGGEQRRRLSPASTHRPGSTSWPIPVWRAAEGGLGAADQGLPIRRQRALHTDNVNFRVASGEVDSLWRPAERRRMDAKSGRAGRAARRPGTDAQVADANRVWVIFPNLRDQRRLLRHRARLYPEGAGRCTSPPGRSGPSRRRSAAAGARPFDVHHCSPSSFARARRRPGARTGAAGARQLGRGPLVGNVARHGQNGGQTLGDEHHLPIFLALE